MNDNDDFDEGFFWGMMFSDTGTGWVGIIVFLIVLVCFICYYYS